jgi:adenosylcobinamide kinase / adenosylcobinamide-phosphate guanylyltransferase
VSPYSHDAEIQAAVDELSQAILSRQDKSWIIVTNEVGWDVVPETALGRAFRDFLGVSNQKFAAIADEVYLMCCGIPMKLKPQS